MKNLIYQVWTGDLQLPIQRGVELMETYAKAIGADYKFAHNPKCASNHTDVKLYYEKFNFLFDDFFLEYDKVAYVDTDVYPVDRLEEDIFAEVDSGFVGICTEPFQGKYRATTTIGAGINQQSDERWAKAVKANYGLEMPRDSDGFLKVFNTGMVVLTREAMIQARKEFVPIQTYVDDMRKVGLGRFYTLDQNYFHAMMHKLKYIEMHNGWNGYVHYVRGPMGKNEPIHDGRTNESKFVHIQLSGAQHFDNETIYNVTNKPIKEWNLND